MGEPKGVGASVLKREVVDDKVLPTRNFPGRYETRLSVKDGSYLRARRAWRSVIVSSRRMRWIRFNLRMDVSGRERLRKDP